MTQTTKIERVSKKSDCERFSKCQSHRTIDSRSRYLMGDRIKLSKELAHSDGLGIDGAVESLFLLIQTLFIQEGESVCEDMQDLRLTSKGLTNQHETTERGQK